MPGFATAHNLRYYASTNTNNRLWPPMSDITNASVKVSAAVGGTLLGITVTDWAAIITIVYVLMQIIVLAPTFLERIRKWRSKHGSSDSAPPPQ